MMKYWLFFYINLVLPHSPLYVFICLRHKLSLLSLVITCTLSQFMCFSRSFFTAPSLPPDWLPSYMLSMSDPAVTTNYLEGLQA